MFFNNGIVLPAAVGRLFPSDITAWLVSRGLSFGSTGERFQSPQQILWILFGLGLVWFIPNSQTLLRAWKPGTGELGSDSENGWLRWTPTFRWAACISVIAVAGLISMDRVSEFLYFQF
jgi:hypothetical protein